MPVWRLNETQPFYCYHDDQGAVCFNRHWASGGNKPPKVFKRKRDAEIFIKMKLNNIQGYEIVDADHIKMLIIEWKLRQI